MNESEQVVTKAGNTPVITNEEKEQEQKEQEQPQQDLEEGKEIKETSGDNKAVQNPNDGPDTNEHGEKPRSRQWLYDRMFGKAPPPGPPSWLCYVPPCISL